MSSLTGLSPNNPRDYVGPNVALNTVVTRNREPTGADYRQPSTGKLYPFNTFWLVGKDPTTGIQGDLWYLSKIVANVAYWIQINAFSPLSISVEVDAATFPGVNPVLTTIGGLYTFNGAAVDNHSVPVETRSRALHEFNLEVQYGTAVVASDMSKSGLLHMNSAQFTCDANGFVSLVNAGPFVASVTGTANRILITGTATNPIVNISPAYVGQTSITTLGTITTGVWNGTTIGTTFGGTGLTSYTTGDTLYASASNVLSKLSVGTNGQVLTLAAGIPSWATPTTGTVTSVTGTANRITITGTASAPIVDIAATYVGQTSITTLGTITTGFWNGSVIPLAYGGTNANLTANNGGIFYSTATAGAILAGTATAGQIIRSGATAAPTWSTATYPATAGTVGNVLTSNGTNWVSSPPVNADGYITITGALTNTQIKNLHATPVVVLPTLGAGQWYRIVNSTGKFIYGGSNVFTAGAGQLIGWYYTTAISANVTLITNSVLVLSSTTYQAFTSPNTTYGTNIETQQFILYNPSATEITGNAANDNTVTYALTYEIVNI